MFNQSTHFQFSTIVALACNVLRLCDGRLENLIINQDVSGGYCQTRVMCWAVYQH